VYDINKDVRNSSTLLGVIRCLHTVVRDENWHRSSVFHSYVTQEKNYKLMIDVGSYANIIIKTTLEKMGLKDEPHPHQYNVNWVDKTTQSITQHCQVPIRISSYQDRIWCDVLDIDVAYILLDRSWLYDLDMTSLGRSNTYEFKWNKKKIVLKPTKSKSNVENNKMEVVTDKKSEKPCYLETRSQSSPETLVDRFTFKT